MKKNIKIGIVSLGCPKTLVDSETILGKLQDPRYSLAPKLEESDVVLLNTCGFIKDAKQESIDAILKLLEFKKEKKLLGLIVMGCLVQRYSEELKKEFPEVDAFVGSGDYEKIAGILKKVSGGEKLISVHRAGYLARANETRVSLTPKFFRYLKITEGCNHTCSFCVIPALRGKFRSRKIPDVVTEAKKLAKEGAGELDLIGQDITKFGYDHAKKSLLPELLTELEKIRGIRWIRLLYAYPSSVTDELIRTVAASKKICRYIDLPLQHISDRILKAMRRGIDKRKTLGLLRKLRGELPGLAIRTSLIVGFPGETERDFQELLEFMGEIKFERLGIFAYSREEGSPAAKLPGQIPERVKEKRYHQAMRLQQKIAKEVSQRSLGKTLEVLVEGRSEQAKDLWVGRSYMDAPDVDGSVLIRTQKKITAGKFYAVKITGTQDYDLLGKI